MSGADYQEYFFKWFYNLHTKQVNGMLKQVRALRKTALLHIARSDASEKDLEPIFDLQAIPFTQCYLMSLSSNMSRRCIIFFCANSKFFIACSLNHHTLFDNHIKSKKY